MKYHINNFWNEYMNKLPDNTHMLFLFRVQFNDGQIRTLCKLQQLNKEDKNYIIDLLENKIQFHYLLDNGIKNNKLKYFICFGFSKLHTIF